MTVLNNWEYNTLLNQRQNVKITSAMGATTVHLTVDTSYHTFDLGPGGQEYGYNYSHTSALNSSRIKDWYSIIKDTFGNGTHVWSYFGIDVPVVGPFTFDVRKVFSAPYVITGYSSVSKNTAAIERAKNSYLNLTQILSITVGFNFPSQLDISYNDAMTAGTTSVATITYVPSDKMEIYAKFNYTVKANLSFWLVQATYAQNFSNTITLDIDTKQVSSLADLLGLNSYTLKDQSLNSYLTLTGLAFYPKLFGTILEGSLQLDVWHILDTLLAPSFPVAGALLKAIGFIVDGLVISLDFSVSGVVTLPISTSSNAVSLNTSEITFSEDKLVNFVEITSTAGASDFDLVVGNISYGLNFNIEWVLSLSFKSPISAFIGGFDWSLGVFPNYTKKLLDVPGGSMSISIVSETTTPPPKGTSSEVAVPFVMSSLVMVLIILPITRKRKY